MSSIVRAIGPWTLKPTPSALPTRWRLGLSPTTPQVLAGVRIEPPPSPPGAHGTRPAATAAAAPPEEPLGDRSRSQGVRHGASPSGSV